MGNAHELGPRPASASPAPSSGPFDGESGCAEEGSCWVRLEHRTGAPSLLTRGAPAPVAPGKQQPQGLPAQHEQGGCDDGATSAPALTAKLQTQELVASSWQYQATGSSAAAAVLVDLHTRKIPTGGPRGMMRAVSDIIQASAAEDTLFVYDLGNTTRLFQAWRAAMPRVTPFYAVKCNPEPALLRLLAALGAGSDCASAGELRAAMALGVPQDRVIFAHPCKMPGDLRFAAAAGVQLTTFDTVGELDKAARLWPAAGLVLRLRCDDPEARVPLGLKFGAEQSEAEGLLAEAKRRGLQVVGVSFHIGSSCKNLAAYGAAIAAARRAFDLGARMGHGAMALLDIGGGFTGRFDARGGVEIAGLVRAVNGALDLNIPPGCGVRVISEPGRFFAEASAAIAARVCGKRDRRPGPPPAGAAPAAVTTAAAPGDVGGDAAGVHKDYWLSDGLYGSFNCVLMDDYVPRPLILSSPLLPPPPAGVAAQGAAAAAAAAGHERVFCSTLWGPTCDSADVLTTTALLPELRIGDWLMFERMGAYTISGACDFNGITATQPAKHYVFSASAVDAAAGGAAGATDADGAAAQ